MKVTGKVLTSDVDAADDTEQSIELCLLFGLRYNSYLQLLHNRS